MLLLADFFAIRPVPSLFRIYVMQNQKKMSLVRRNRSTNLFNLENRKSTGYLESRHLLRNESSPD